jgi:hypothetical protein
MLLSTDNEGWTVWLMAERWGYTDSFKKLWDCAEENLTTEEINNKMIFATYIEGWTAWHWAAG